MRHLTLTPSTGLAALAFALLTGDASAQNRYLFSIDWQGPTVGVPDASGVPITEGDVLMPSTGTAMPALGAPAPPTIAIPHGLGGLGLLPGCAGHPGGTPCLVEVDALSLGVDHRFQPNVPIRAGQVLFSVDEYATAITPVPVPCVGSESPSGDAAADAFVNLAMLPPAPLAPMAGRNVGVQDGDGLPSGSGVTCPSVGLIEPSVAAPGPFNGGDSIDGLDVVEPTAVAAIGRFFSLDAGFLDPVDGVPNNGSAGAHGFVGGDVLTTPFGGAAPVLYAPAMMLGLDLVGGPDSDDLDALILRENNTPGYQRSFVPYDWMTPNTDMLIFSVRRGSAVIGMPDSMFGIPIMPGDLLVPPIPTAIGGVSPFPAIFIAAENLGLSTFRSGGVSNDDLCAADSLRGTIHDCDGDGVEDAVAIAMGSAVDTNLDGVPDSCQGLAIGTPFCLCAPGSPAPCGNFFAAGGCLNASGTGAILSGSGSASVGANNLTLTTSGMNPATFYVPIISATSFGPALIQNGKLCVGPVFQRMGIFPTGTGTASFGPIVSLAASLAPTITILPLSTWNFQVWYRDFGGPCGGASNLSNALSVTFTP